MRSGFLSCALPAFGVRALPPFCFSQISGGVFAVQKNKRLFLSCRMRSGLVWMQKTHSTLTTLYISRILILYIYGKFIGS
jgi:hypothetical protein